MGLLRRFAPRNDSKQVNRLRNKCAMTGYGHAELVSVSCVLTPSPAFQAPSAQGRQGHTHRTALRISLSTRWGKGKKVNVGEMKENNFLDTDFSLLTKTTYFPTLFSIIKLYPKISQIAFKSLKVKYSLFNFAEKLAGLVFFPKYSFNLSDKSFCNTYSLFKRNLTN